MDNKLHLTNLMTAFDLINWTDNIYGKCDEASRDLINTWPNLVVVSMTTCDLGNGFEAHHVLPS